MEGNGEESPPWGDGAAAASKSVDCIWLCRDNGHDNITGGIYVLVQTIFGVGTGSEGEYGGAGTSIKL